MPNVKLDHCVIHVSDWEISNTFYRDVLGAELVPRESVGRTDSETNNSTCMAPAFPPAPVAKLPVQPGNSDLCFEWPGAYRRGEGAPGT